MCEWFRLARSPARFVPSEVMPEAAHDRYDAVYAEPARHRHVPRHTDPTREAAVGPRCGPQVGGVVVDPDPTWQRYAELASRIRTALGWGVLDLDHVGSTSVSGLVAKSIIDTNLTVADPKEESACVPALEAVALRLRVREPWWYARAEVAR